MSKEPHFTHHSELSPVAVRDLRGGDPVVLRAWRRQDAVGPARPRPDGVGEARPDSARADRTETAQRRERVAELTADLQRVKAEYDNYRKRVHRDRLAIREIAVVNVLTGLLPVLDVVEEARRRDDVSGAAAVISDVLEERLAALGLRAVGAAGELFDPHTHEAITYLASGAARESVCTEVLRHGYQVGDHLLRPAQVAVTGPTPAA
ncbi:nucleotide exchange factor GrpE [Streptomyces sp. Ncost-T10-10d]|uniref:nucleotide exchange factor GrpE n=1 Tax=Streptomyces sp. Ncost-T10-10d TaxID=1839774 RepID=UPI00081E8F4D|nr:nucleotide exchange factor GrpE [Streptomyces sp. Ncost-T10-10d]SCF93263.1 molecular chaperone GrpE [Streptomyces sp. Ncost-T10-10d]